MLLLGTFAPTLALLLTAGAMARTGAVHLLPVIVAATAAAVAGDRLAHWSGHLLGERLRTGGLGRRIPAGAWQQAETLMTRHAGRSVFLGRFLPMVRTLTPHLVAPPACPTAASPPTAPPQRSCGPPPKPASATAQQPLSSRFSPSAVRPSPWSR